MKDILNRLINHETLSSEEAKQVIVNISNDMYNPSQIACFLSVFMMRSITIEELKGFRNALLELCVAVDLKDFNAVDIVGTGGDGKYRQFRNNMIQSLNQLDGVGPIDNRPSTD